MLKKLFHYFKTLIPAIRSKKSKETHLGLKILLKPDYTVDVLMEYPDIENQDIFYIANLAEKYAELITYTSTSALKYKLIEMIQDRAYLTENTKEKLFFDNVCHFYEIIKKEIKNNQSNTPLIRPISVFTGK